MIKKISIVAFVLCAFSIQSIQAQAATLSFDPSSQSVGLGDPVTVDLRISDLGAEILTSFDLDVSFDDSVLGFAGFDFGTELDAFGFGTIQSADDFGSFIRVKELTLDFNSDLASQPDDFVLGTFNFVGSGLGFSTLSVSGLLGGAVVDFFDSKVLDFDVEGGSVTVAGVSPVPVPAAIWLFGTGLVGLIGFSRRRKTFVGG